MCVVVGKCTVARGLHGGVMMLEALMIACRCVEGIEGLLMPFSCGRTGNEALMVLAAVCVGLLAPGIVRS